MNAGYALARLGSRLRAAGCGLPKQLCGGNSRPACWDLQPGKATTETQRRMFPAHRKLQTVRYLCAGR